MSTGLECNVNERKPGEWYYILEGYDSPKMAFDWREYATAYGPFKSRGEAEEHLHDNHANPGGLSVNEYRPDHVEDEVERKLYEEAPKHTSRTQPRRW